MRLLGLIGMWETTGDCWQEYNKPKTTYYDWVLERVFPDSITDIEDLSEEDFANLVADYQLFFERIAYAQISNTISRQALFELIDNFYK